MSELRREQLLAALKPLEWQTHRVPGGRMYETAESPLCWAVVNEWQDGSASAEIHVAGSVGKQRRKMDSFEAGKTWIETAYRDGVLLMFNVELDDA